VANLLEVLRLKAFSSVPGWWPRTYLTLLLFGRFKDTGYTALPYMLRERVKDVGLGKSTLYKALDTLIQNGLIEKRDNLYILTKKGFSLLSTYSSIESELKRCVEEKDVECLSKVKERLSTLGGDSDFEQHAKTYFNVLVDEAVTIMKKAIEIEGVV